MSIEKTLQDRENTHGPWVDGCQVSQQIKRVMDRGRADSRPDFVNEAIDRIAMKLSRIAVGDCLETDHWHDIAGYAKLTEEAIKKMSNPQISERR